ncbi:LytTR family transcriptional regulator DNA-binding domain-containing protein [Achromobacter sp. GG226]|uniref:LytTR family transcriptional regulator DNA-binding domain-containing protein n=1 Tax=Verticiella alkaliphila TaxID=2779529 RepID=UPI001C0D4B8D|nr:LytTR family transcriptional regulator DNA-binding domain-containing protein [Verticiella sp. GG226]MBU4610106.1 LytTR family transcriptional regulator DNA-binding domain-containing protein [Verticiella sp. GG226]
MPAISSAASEGGAAQVAEGGSAPAWRPITTAAVALPGQPDWPFHAAQALLSLPADEAVSAILEATGLAAQADRAWMFEYDDELLRFRNTHEWARRGVPSFIQDLQDAPVTIIAWLQPHLLAGRSVLIADVPGMPRVARALQAELLRQGNASILCVPIHGEGKLRACLGLDATRAPVRWSDAQVAALARCADLIGRARYGAGHAGRSTGGSLAAALVYLRHRHGVHGVERDRIVALRAARNRTDVWLTGGGAVVDLRPLGQWTALLPPAVFVRIHRTTLVNLKHVRHVERSPAGRWRVQVDRPDGGWLPVARSCQRELQARLGL